MDSFYLIITLALMFIGLAGAVLPILPSIPVIYGAYFIYGLGTGWRDYGLGVMIILGLVTGLIMLADYLAGAVGARKFGASAAGMAGSVVGAVLGLIFFNVIGLIAGVFAGAVFGELYWGKTSEQALKAGGGALLGYLAGSLLRFAAASAMIAAFIFLVLT